MYTAILTGNEDHSYSFMYIHVRVSTDAKEDKFAKIKESHYAAQVRQKAQRNLANKRVAELIAEYYGISPKSVRLVSGHHSPSKLFSLPDSE